MFNNQLIQYDREKPLSLDGLIYNEGYWEDLGLPQPIGFWPMFGPEMNGLVQDYSPSKINGILTANSGSIIWASSIIGQSLNVASGWWICRTRNTTIITICFWKYSNSGYKVSRILDAFSIEQSSEEVNISIKQNKYSQVVDETNIQVNQKVLKQLSSNGIYCYSSMHVGNPTHQFQVLTFRRYSSQYFVQSGSINDSGQ